MEDQFQEDILVFFLKIQQQINLYSQRLCSHLESIQHSV